jgi:hypothetical protein
LLAPLAALAAAVSRRRLCLPRGHGIGTMAG